MKTFSLVLRLSPSRSLLSLPFSISPPCVDLLSLDCTLETYRAHFSLATSVVSSDTNPIVSEDIFSTRYFTLKHTLDLLAFFYEQ